MENPTAFDLNTAIQRWRNVQGQSPAMQAGDLEELESHLRDAVGDLRARGLSEAEAFMVAARRMGRPETLAEEFGKVNPIAVWRDRALWMLAGMLFLVMGMDLASAVSSAFMYFGSAFSSNGLTLGWVGGITRIAASCIVVWVFWRLAIGRLSGVRVIVGRLSRRPLLCIAGAVLCLWLLDIAPGLFHMLFIRNIEPTAIGQSFVITGWFGGITPLIQLVLMIVIFAKLWKGRSNSVVAGRVAAWALILPVAMGVTLASANAETNTGTGKSVAAEKQAPATLDQAMTLWRAGKTNEAAATFLAVDFTKRPLFPFGSVLNYTEVQFIALPDAAREKMSKQMMDDIQVLKQICAHIRDAGESAEAAGDKTKAAACRAQLLKGGAAFNQPDSLALLKLVGKALMKMSLSVGK